MNELSNVNRDNLPAPQILDDGQSETEFNPYIVLGQDKTQAVVDGIARPGDYILNKDGNLTNTIDMFVIDQRFCAVEFEGQTIAQRTYDPTSSIYKEIAASANRGMMGYKYGKEVLLWLFPKQCFATFHFNGGTTRRLGKQKIRLSTDGEKKTTENRFEQITPEIESDLELLRKTKEELFIGGLFQVGSRWTSVLQSFNAKDRNTGKQTKVNVWKPVINYLCDEYWADKYGSPPWGMFKKAMEAFRNPTIAEENEDEVNR